MSDRNILILNLAVLALILSGFSVFYMMTRKDGDMRCQEARQLITNNLESCDACNGGAKHRCNYIKKALSSTVAHYCPEDKTRMHSCDKDWTECAKDLNKAQSQFNDALDNCARSRS